MKWRIFAGLITGVAVLVLSFAIYWPGLSGGFFFDDSAIFLSQPIFN